MIHENSFPGIGTIEQKEKEPMTDAMEVQYDEIPTETEDRGRCKICKGRFSSCMHCPGCQILIGRHLRMQANCQLCRECGATTCHECATKCGREFRCKSCQE